MARKYNLTPEGRIKHLEACKKGGANSRKNDPPGASRGGWKYHKKPDNESENNPEKTLDTK